VDFKAKNMIPIANEDWPQSVKEEFRKAMFDVWVKHNRSRNEAFFDFKNPQYVQNRIKADTAWIEERDKTATEFGNRVCQKG
jgi:hypothetical protein